MCTEHTTNLVYISSEYLPVIQTPKLPRKRSWMLTVLFPGFSNFSIVFLIRDAELKLGRLKTITKLFSFKIHFLCHF